MLKTALVLGATGLVGKSLVEQLCADKRYQRVTCLIRKPLPKDYFADNSHKVQAIVVDFEQLQDYQGYFSAAHIYVCLGTTIKQAGSKQAFRKVDFEYVHVAAQLAKTLKAGSFVWISSVGANAHSPNFYLRVKGELENAILNMPGLPNAAAVRPSLLLGERNEMRPAEKLAAMFSPLISPFLLGGLKKYRPVQAAEVATHMIRLQVF
ncbi:NAD(P)H-binding protein [uncultured Paraglaciecola sp.]|uniref:NAD(P)H-binding protein n=1 Tax=uncultured Paraglaciecola sp. TaxID=1765024 RepID=UPI002606B7BC|nr:NAD(P)H-binding protein [uncultured Paraglaciecola sp.]